jgi:hypothetical protein
MFPLPFFLFFVSGALGQSLSQTSPTSTLEPCAQIGELQKSSLAADPTGMRSIQGDVCLCCFHLLTIRG